MFLLLQFSGWVSAQDRQIVEAASGEDLSKKVSTQMQYVFPEFTTGDVYFKGLPKSSGKLNYNMLLGEMQFVEKDQVMALANVKDVVLVNIGNRKFYPFNDKEFTEELLSTGNYQLRVKRKGSMAQHAKKGAYGGYSSTSAITSYSSIGADNRVYNLSVTENILVSVNYLYYLVGSNNKYTPIRNVKTFTKQFPKSKVRIETFVKEHNTQFDNGNDLIALLEYCSKLGN